MLIILCKAHIDVLDDTALEKLLGEMESDCIERKRDDSNMSSIRKTICAFANDVANTGRLGVLFVGVDDDGKPTGLNITDELLRKLSDIATDGNILPLPHIVVQKKNLCGIDLAVVMVEPAEAPPVRYQGTVWIRTGPRLAIASQQQENSLTEKRRFKDTSFDLRAARDATLEDLDLRTFSEMYLPKAISPEILAENHRTIDEQLATLRFACRSQLTQPTNCGVLVLGKEPTNFIPGDYIQFVRVAGDKIGDPIADQKEIRGPLPHILASLDELLKINIQTATEFTAADLELRRPDYPIVALQQIARNAVMHRSYEGTHAPIRITWFSDCVEIQNPGGPFGRVNKDNFGKPEANDYRNSYLAEAMKVLGYVQRFGFGIAQARLEMEKNGNPPIEFDVQDFHVGAILRKRA